MPVFLVALLPVLFAALRLFLVANMVGFFLRLLLALGLSFYVIEPLTDQLYDLIAGAMDGLMGDVAAWIGFLNFDKYLSYVLSAQTIAFTTNFALRMNK